MQSQTQFAHPSKQAIQNFLKIQNNINNPTSYLSSLPSFILITSSVSLLIGSIFYSLNPTGTVQRINLYKNMSIHKRYIRRFSPLIIILAGMYQFDKSRGIW